MKTRKPKFGDKMKVLVNEPDCSDLKKNEIVIFWYKDIDKGGYVIIPKSQTNKWYIKPEYLKLIEETK